MGSPVSGAIDQADATRQGPQRPTHLLAALAAACFGLALLAAPASAFLSYPESQTLSDHTGANPQVAIDGSDRATVVWWQLYPNGRIESVRIAADGTPGPVQALSEIGHDAFSPQVAIDGSDRATVVWVRSDGTNTRIQSVRLASDGTPGPVQTVSEAGEGAGSPQIAIDGSDRATVAWYRSDGANDRIQSVRLAADGTPGPVQTVSEAGAGAGSPQIAIDGSDRATVVWNASLPGGDLIQLVRVGAHGTRGAVETLPEIGDSDTSEPQVAIDGSDRATVVWRGSICCSVGIVESARLTAKGTVGRVFRLSKREGFHSSTPNPQLAIDGADRATITWPEQDITTGARPIEAVRAEITYPQTSITKGVSKLIHRSRVRFKFESSVSAVSSFECKLDKKRFKRCTSPRRYRSLAEGRHKFSVRAIDDEGDVDPTPAERSFTVDTVQGSVAAKKKQKQKGSNILVKAKVKARERLTAKATGRIEVGKRSFDLETKTRRLSSGSSKRLKLRPEGSKDAAKIADALRKGKKAKAKVTVKLADRAGNKKSKMLSVRLKG